ncbi:hypothetical protein BDV3_002672 [Batrachochytrium dendrobatidis]
MQQAIQLAESASFAKNHAYLSIPFDTKQPQSKLVSIVPAISKKNTFGQLNRDHCKFSSSICPLLDSSSLSTIHTDSTMSFNHAKNPITVEETKRLSSFDFSTSNTQSISFGFASSINILQLQSPESNWKVRLVAMESILASTQLIHVDTFLPHIQAFIEFVIPSLCDDNFKVILTTLYVIEQILKVVGANIQAAVSKLSVSLAHLLTDTRAIIRQTCRKLLIELMRATYPMFVYECILPLLSDNNPRVREEIITMLIISLFTFPNQDLNIPFLAQCLAPVFKNAQAKVRFVAVEACAVLASKSSQSLIILALSTHGVDPDSLQLLEMRFLDKQLPFLTSDGTVKHIFSQNCLGTADRNPLNKIDQIISNDFVQKKSESDIPCYKISRLSESPVKSSHFPIKELPYNQNEQKADHITSRIFFDNQEYKYPQNQAFKHKPRSLRARLEPENDNFGLQMSNDQSISLAIEDLLKKAAVLESTEILVSDPNTINLAPMTNVSSEHHSARDDRLKSESESTGFQRKSKTTTLSTDSLISCNAASPINNLTSASNMDTTLQICTKVTCDNLPEKPITKQISLTQTDKNISPNETLTVIPTASKCADNVYNSPEKSIQKTKTKVSRFCESDLKHLISKLQPSQDWCDIVDAMNLLQTAFSDHPAVFTANNRDILLVLLANLQNLRTTVSKLAIQCILKIYQLASKTLEPHLDGTISSLLRKIGEGNQFIIEEIDHALLAFCEIIPPARLAVALVANASHKNSLIRLRVSRLVHQVLKKMSTSQLCHVLQNIRDTDKLLPALAQLMKDGLVDTRNSGKQAMQILYQCPEFDRAMGRSLSISQIAEVRETLNKLIKKSSFAVKNQDLVDESVSSENLIQVKTLPTFKSKPKGKSVASHSEHSDTLKEILKETTVHDWNGRYRSMEKLCKYLHDQPTLLTDRGLMQLVLDVYCDRCRDGNSKVGILSLKSLTDLIPRFNSSSINSAVPALVSMITNQFASTHPAIQNAAINAIDALLQIADDAIILPALITIIHYGTNSKVKVQIVDILCSSIKAGHLKLSSAIRKHMVPCCVKLFEENRSDMCHHTNRLILELQGLMGDKLFDAMVADSKKADIQHKLATLLKQGQT